MIYIDLLETKQRADPGNCVFRKRKHITDNPYFEQTGAPGHGSLCAVNGMC
jgi:hypothetical protein